MITIGFAIAAAFILPDYPHTTKWLSEEERAFAAWRLAEDVNEEDAQHAQSVWAGTKMAFKDYRLYIFVLLQHVSILSQTFQYFFPSIVNTLGYGKIETLWLTAPVWVCFSSAPIQYLPCEAGWLVSISDANVLYTHSLPLS